MMAAIYLIRTSQFSKRNIKASKIFQEALKNKISIQNLYFSILQIENEASVPAEIQKGPKKQEEYKVKAILSNKSEIIFESGKLAKFADGCAVVTFQGTSVMAAAVSKFKGLPSSFLPLTVSYQQKAAALGRIPLNFLRREYGQNENEILTSRMIDRSIRPLFPKNFSSDTQIFCNPLCIDGNNFPDVLSINAASAALAVSDIPWNGPVAAVRLGLIKEDIIINPSKKELNESSINLVVSSKGKNYVVMLEGSFSQIYLHGLKKVIKAGVKECQKICEAIVELSKMCGKKKKELPVEETNEDLYNSIKLLSKENLIKILSNYELDKTSRDEALSSLQNSVYDEMKEVDYNVHVKTFYKVVKEIFCDLIFEKNIRCDGRSLNMLRHINCEVDLYKSLHGSALFQRGQTQVFCTVALDSPNSALKMDNISMLTSGVKEKNFFVHYEFPPYATNELGKVGPIGRREIGHGILAEKALKSCVPNNFPFTIRLTSEVLESNGSSSMATVCGGSLALLDAGIPLSSPCAGVAMGIVTKFSKTEPSKLEDYRIMTDLLGIEDYFGDMDFKIAGTKKAFTALQMDVKTPGLPITVIMEAIDQSKGAIVEILKIMYSVCPGPRIKEKSNWPILKKLSVPIHLRAKFIGLGGIHIKKLEMNTGVQLLEEAPGEFSLFAANAEALNEAEEKVREFIAEHQQPQLEFGGVYTATITEIRDNGCMITLYPDMDPVLLPLSQLDVRKVAHPSVLALEIGQEIQVKYFGRDPVSGVVRISRKVLQAPKSEKVQSFFPKKSDDEISKEDVQKSL